MCRALGIPDWRGQHPVWPPIDSEKFGALAVCSGREYSTEQNHETTQRYGVAEWMCGVDLHAEVARMTPSDGVAMQQQLYQESLSSNSFGQEEREAGEE